MDRVIDGRVIDDPLLVNDWHVVVPGRQIWELEMFWRRGCSERTWSCGEVTKVFARGMISVSIAARNFPAAAFKTDA